MPVPARGVLAGIPDRSPPPDAASARMTRIGVDARFRGGLHEG